MARINRYLETALCTRSEGEERSTRLADSLVPLTFATGLGVFALTSDPSRAASVLTVDYSCAIKLSNPVAVRSKLYAASRAGVLFKGAQALENLDRVDTLAGLRRKVLCRCVKFHAASLASATRGSKAWSRA